MGVYKRGKQWWIAYTLKGKRVRKPAGDRKDKAVAEYQAICVDIRGGRYKEPRRDLFDDLAKQYEAIKKEKKGYVSEQTYIKRAKEFFKSRIVQDIGVLDVEQYKGYIIGLPTRYKSKAPRSGEDINHHLNCLRAMLQKAIKWEWIEKNPALGGKVERLPVPPGRNEFLSKEQAGKLLSACHPHLKPIVLCALETGMRKSEILGLFWRDIRNGQIYLTGDRTKNGKPREIPVSANLATELKRLQGDRKAGTFVLASDLVFNFPKRRTARRKGHLEVITGPMVDIRSAWATAKKAAGIPMGFHFHDLRHTTASWLKMAGVDDYTVMEILGHSDFKMMKRYAHLTSEHKRDALDRLPEWNEKKAVSQFVTIQENGATAETPQPLDFAGAEAGI